MRGTQNIVIRSLNSRYWDWEICSLFLRLIPSPWLHETIPIPWKSFLSPWHTFEARTRQFKLLFPPPYPLITQIPQIHWSCPPSSSNMLPKHVKFYSILLCKDTTPPPFIYLIHTQETTSKKLQALPLRPSRDTSCSCVIVFSLWSLLL